jgi:hypothetical protein
MIVDFGKCHEWRLVTGSWELHYKPTPEDSFIRYANDDEVELLEIIRELRKDKQSAETRISELESERDVLIKREMEKVKIICALHEKVSRCGGENCMGYRVDGVAEWVRKERFRRVQAERDALALSLIHTIPIENLAKE